MRKSFLVLGPALILAAWVGKFYLTGGNHGSSVRHFHEGERLYHEGQLNQATSEMEQALRDDPLHVEARDALGTLYQMQDRPDDEVKTYRDGIRLMPDDPRMYYSLGMAFYASRRYNDAAEQMRECLRVGPYDAQYSHLLGMCYEKSGKLAEAQSYWISSLHEHPRDEVILRGLRRVERKLKPSGHVSSGPRSGNSSKSSRPVDPTQPKVAAGR